MKAWLTSNARKSIFRVAAIAITRWTLSIEGVGLLKPRDLAEEFTVEVFCNDSSSNPLTTFMGCNPPGLDQTKVRDGLLHVVQFWLGDGAASFAVFQVLNLLMHTFETLLQVKLLYTLVIFYAIRFPNQDIMTTKTHLHKIMFIASVEANRVKRTRKHLRRGGRSKRRWTFKCAQARNQHRLTTTSPKPIKVQTCLNQFFWILTDFSFQLLSVGLNLPLEPSRVLNLCSRCCWAHPGVGSTLQHQLLLQALASEALPWGSPERVQGSTRLSFFRCSSNSEKRFRHALLCRIPGASIPLSHAGHLGVGSKDDTSGKVLSELSGLPLATSASAGDAGDGVTWDDWTAGVSCGVTTTFDLVNGTAGAKRNSPNFFTL